MPQEFIGEVLPECVARIRLRKAIETMENGKRPPWSNRPESDKIASPEDSASGAKRRSHRAQRVSLGLDTYLAAGAQHYDGSSVFDLVKTPSHRWRMKKTGSCGKRGAVSGFSAKSRTRLMKKLAECQSGISAHFITLTVPWNWPPDTMKNALWAFWKRIERKYPKKNLSMVWKMEPHKKGDWHFHLIAYGLGFFPHMIAKAMWQSVIRSQGITGAFHYGVDLKHIESGDFTAIRNYVLKYMAKEFDGEECAAWTGRVWGSRGKLPRGERITTGMSLRELVWMWRLIARKRKRNIVKMSPVFFTDSPELWLENVRKVAKMSMLC